LKKTIKVIGSGPTGSLLALSLASSECNVVLIEPLSDAELLAKDKGYAVTQCTRKILNELGIWSAIKETSSGFTSLSIIDDVISQSVLIRKSDLKTLNQDQLNIGWVIEHRELMKLLIENINKNKYIKKLNFDSTKDENHDFILAADGRDSSSRERWGIKYFRSLYNQRCISFKAVLNGLPDKRAYEIFRDEGPLALLPLTKNIYQVIWFSNKSEIESKLELSDKNLLKNLKSVLPDNAIPEKIITKVSTFSVSKAFALTKFKDSKFILVGDSAHSFHPVGGQGLNSCIRDVYELSNLIKNFENLSILNRKYFALKYFLQRSIDIISLLIFTDFLIRFFSNKLFILYPFRYIIFFIMKKLKFVRINIFSVMTDSIKSYKFRK
tara:strand:+ start:5618 stop:6763 length:1146 start_codon:yes stop_codon:yes gene_type:complete